MQTIKKSLSLLTLFTILALNIPTSLATSSWPADTIGTDIIWGIDAVYSGFEPSGISWNKGRNTYFVVDDSGKLAEIEEDGTLVNYWDVGSYDFEGTAFKDDYSTTIYLANEATTGALGFDLVAGSLTGESWSFYPEITPSGLLGLEGIEWIPDGVHPYGGTKMGGVFYAGSQVDGDIFVFEPTSDTTEDFVEEIHTPSDHSDISALEYDEDSGILFAAYDGYNVFQELTPAGELLAEYSFPSTDGSAQEEGIAVRSDCSEGTAVIAVADDNGHIMVYDNLPITCPIIDDDDDGVVLADDCDDEDPSLTSLETYYQDADGDGYGNPAVTIEFCSFTPPSGYVDNADDLYDNTRIEISGDKRDNDGDPTVDEMNTLAENGIHPLYGDMDPKTSYPIEEFYAKGSSLVVKYTDHSIYRYMTDSTLGFGILCSANQISKTSYFLIGCGFDYAILNGLDGYQIAEHGGKISLTAAKAWAEKLVRLL